MTKVDGMMFLADDLSGVPVNFINNDGDGILQTCGQKMRCTPADEVKGCATCILDAEELKPVDCSVNNLYTTNLPDGLTTSTTSDYYPWYWNYYYQYPMSPVPFHDIQSYKNKDGVEVQLIDKSLDPTNPDTDGDGVQDGVEIVDSKGMWPDDESGLYNNDNSATDPLDPNKFNPDEVGLTIAMSHR